MRQALTCTCYRKPRDSETPSNKSVGRTRLLAPTLLLLGSLSIAGCVGVAGTTTTSGKQNLSAPAAAAISLSPSSINLGPVAIGSAVSQSVTVSNTGGSTLTVTQASVAVHGFTLSGVSLPMTISAGQQTTFNVLFMPAAAGAVSGAVSVMSNVSSSPATINVSGIGVAATSLLDASSTSLNFGNVNRAASSVLGVTFTNAGNSNVTILNVSIPSGPFSTSGLSAGLILAPGQNATLNVVFAPVTAGSLTDSVTVTSNATNSPATISLSGTGVGQPVSHSVALNWAASTSAVAGYNVYRSAVSGGPYTKLNSTLVTTTQYTDFAVHPGQTFYYVVASVDSSNVESAYSNEASATVSTH